MSEVSKGPKWSIVGALLVFSVGLGFVVGGCWRLLAPNPELLIVGDGGVGYVTLANSGVGMDLSFGLLAAVAGVIVAVTALLRFPSAALYSFIGVVVGGVVGSLIAWRFGLFLDPGLDEYGPELAQGRAENEVFEGPLVLSAFGVLGMWALAGCTTLAIGFGRRARRARIALAKMAAAPQSQVSTDA